MKPALPFPVGEACVANGASLRQNERFYRESAGVAFQQLTVFDDQHYGKIA
jgi:hypothetical protein